MKKVWISLICLCAAAVAVTSIYLYRRSLYNMQLSIERTDVRVGSGPELGIRALATGRYVEKAVELTPKIEGVYDTNKVGTYTIKVSAEYKGTKISETYTIRVFDDVAPVITLKTTEGYYTLPGSKYEEEGFTATDNYDGDITDKVERTETGDRIVYTVTDSSGNKATAERPIEYTDPVPPVITLLGDAEITSERRAPFADPGATAKDNLDGDLTEQITVDGTVDNTVIGDYKLTYTVTDSFGNIGTANRVIHIVERARPLGDEAEALGKVVYLTFDDGPGPYTQKLLDVLDKYDVKVTFFVCNNNMDEMIAEEAKRGHTVGVHAWKHDYKLLYTSTDDFFDYYYQMQDLVFDLTGVRTNLMRFPGGSSNTVSRNYKKGIMTELAKMCEEKGIYYFDWNVSSGDATGTPISSEQVYKNVVNGIIGLKGKPAVVLQHDIKSFSVDAVEEIIKWGLANGYTFMPLDETSYGAHHGINN